MISQVISGDVQPEKAGALKMKFRLIVRRDDAGNIIEAIPELRPKWYEPRWTRAEIEDWAKRHGNVPIKWDEETQ